MSDKTKERRWSPSLGSPILGQILCESILPPPTPAGKGAIRQCGSIPPKITPDNSYHSTQKTSQDDQTVNIQDPSSPQGLWRDTRSEASSPETHTAPSQPPHPERCSGANRVSPDAWFCPRLGHRLKIHCGLWVSRASFNTPTGVQTKTMAPGTH